MSDRAFASDYPHGFLDQLKPIKPLFVSAIDGSELLQADRAGNQRQAFSKNPHIKNIPAEAGIEEIARSLRMSLVPMLESDLSPTNRYRRYK